MKVENLCEICGKPEKGYSVSEANLKLRKVGRGPARKEVESFTCSRCVQRQLSQMNLKHGQGMPSMLAEMAPGSTISSD
jgi:hypothetical protein